MAKYSNQELFLLAHDHFIGVEQTWDGNFYLTQTGEEVTPEELIEDINFRRDLHGYPHIEDEKPSFFGVLKSLFS